jgi:hypothetical protein
MELASGNAKATEPCCSVEQSIKAKKIHRATNSLEYFFRYDQCWVVFQSLDRCLFTIQSSVQNNPNQRALSQEDNNSIYFQTVMMVFWSCKLGKTIWFQSSRIWSKNRIMDYSQIAKFVDQTQYTMVFKLQTTISPNGIPKRVRLWR